MPGSGFDAQHSARADWNAFASNFINAVPCIDEATVENGCLELTVRPHRRSLLRGMELLHGEDMAGMEFVRCPIKLRDILLFDACSPCRSAPNPATNTSQMHFATCSKAAEGDHYDPYRAD